MQSAANPPAASSPDDKTASRRVHLKGIKELPAGYDSEIGTIFCEMRRASQLSKEQLAEQFETEITTLDALEAGALLALPDWTETSRVVTAYTEALGLDCRPILRRMAAQLAPEAVARRPDDPPDFVPPEPLEPPIPEVPDAYASFEPIPEDKYLAPRSDDTETEGAGPRRTGFGFGRALRWLMLLLMLGGVGYGAWYTWQRPEAMTAAIDRLPDPLPGMVWSAWDVLRPLSPATDPRTRKSDKLPVESETSSN